MSDSLTITNATYLDVPAGEYRRGNIRVVDGVIQQVDDGIDDGIGDGRAPSDDPRFDASGKYVLPGLIDCHVHVTAVTADLAALTEWSPGYVAYGAAKLMGEMLDRGFTTVRDVAGADFGIHDAQAEGLLRAPKVFFGGKALTQTGGHGDSRSRGRSSYDPHHCCAGLGRIADGVDAVRHAARDELPPVQRETS